MIVNLWCEHIIPACDRLLTSGATNRKIMHDEEEYPEPDTYLPERHLDENGNLGNTVRDPLSIAFGFGRR
jgi:hypothetical protein